MNAIIAFITAALQLAPLLEQLGEDLVPLAKRVYEVVTKGGDPTDEDWGYLHDLQDKAKAAIDQPVPEDET